LAARVFHPGGLLSAAVDQFDRTGSPGSLQLAGVRENVQFRI